MWKDAAGLPKSEALSPSSLILGMGRDKKSLTDSFFLLKAHTAMYRDVRKHEKANKTYVYLEAAFALQPRLAEDC